MNVFQLNSAARALSLGSVVSVGNFDGVHLGHRAILNEVLVQAAKKNLASLVVIFEPQPKEYFAAQEPPARLYGLREKLWVMQQIGIDYLVCIHFNDFFSNLSPQEFFYEYLIKKYAVKHLVIGEDFCFGKRRSGSVSELRKMSQILKISLDVYHFYQLDGLKVSSTAIRTVLAQANFTMAERLLGQSYFMMGRVIYGRQLARQWGVPTANLKIARHNYALRGVFCVKIRNCRTQEQWQGVANLGVRPSVDGQKISLEVHCFNFQGLLYGEFLQVFFLHKLRDEQKFSSIEALQRQIHVDLQQAQDFFQYGMQMG